MPATINTLSWKDRSGTCRRSSIRSAILLRFPRGQNGACLGLGIGSFDRNLKLTVACPQLLVWLSRSDGGRVRSRGNVSSWTNRSGDLHLETRATSRASRACRIDQHLAASAVTAHSPRARASGCRSFGCACCGKGHSRQAPRAQCSSPPFRQRVSHFRDYGPTCDRGDQSCPQADQRHRYTHDRGSFERCASPRSPPGLITLCVKQAWRKLDSHSGPAGVPTGMMFGVSVYDPRLS